MAITDRSSRMHSWAQSCLGCLCALAASFAPWASAESAAAPVTFRFEAEVTEITPSADASFALPSEIAINATLNGMVTFEPPLFFGYGLGTSGASLAVSTGPSFFLGDQLKFSSENDGGLCAGFICYSWDSITVAGGADSQYVYSTIGPSLVSQRGIGLGFRDEFTTINPLFEYGLDQEAWNRFAFRRLTIELTSPVAAGSYLIFADVGPVRAVPEPASLCQAIFLTALTFLGFQPRKRSSLRMSLV